jgi:hypothetical protein
VTGESEPFGPVFRQAAVTSLAVSPDGSRVAIALLGSSQRTSGIEVRPMPGHRGHVRFWRILHGIASDVVSLSWAPDGLRLSYIVGAQTGGGLQGGLKMLDTAARSSVAPGLSDKYGEPFGPCQPDAAAWLRNSGRLVALEDCGNPVTGRGREILAPVDPHTGRVTGPEQVIAHQVGCGSPGLAPSSDGSRVLVSYCGLFLDDNGKLSALLPAGLVAAAFAGVTVTP